LKTKRHPQLEKIEAYFKDCNPEYIPRTPLMKIPTVFEIEREREMERMENSRQNGTMEGYQVSTMGMGMGMTAPSDQGLKYGTGGASGQNFNFAHQKTNSIPSKGFPSVKGLINIAEGRDEQHQMVH
jgi:hypothetical protein